MDEALEILASEQCVRSRATPRLKLLLAREPAHHVFFSNPLEALKLRLTPRLDLTQPPMDFWRNVFLPSELPWKSFQESLLWHLVAAIAAWALSQGWASRPEPHVRESFRTAESIYYAPSKVFPAARSTPPRTKRQAPWQKHTAAEASAAMKVAAEPRKPAMVVPPDLKAAIG